MEIDSYLGGSRPWMPSSCLSSMEVAIPLASLKWTLIRNVSIQETFTPRVPDVVHPGNLCWSCRCRRGHSCLLMFTRMSLLSLMLSGTGSKFDQLHRVSNLTFPATHNFPSDTAQLGAAYVGPSLGDCSLYVSGIRGRLGCPPPVLYFLKWYLCCEM